MTHPVGTILVYDNYPYGEDKKIKPYWFIVMGRTPFLDKPQHYHLFKTTTQNHHYQSGGSRSDHISKRLDCSTYPCFDKDCYIDFNYPPTSQHTIEKIKELEDKGTVSIKGRLDESLLKELYHLAIKGSGSPYIVKQDFHTSFNNDGITGLKAPQKRDKNYHRKKYTHCY